MDFRLIFLKFYEFEFSGCLKSDLLNELRFIWPYLTWFA